MKTFEYIRMKRAPLTKFKDIGFGTYFIYGSGLEEPDPSSTICIKTDTDKFFNLTDFLIKNIDPNKSVGVLEVDQKFVYREK